MKYVVYLGAFFSLTFGSLIVFTLGLKNSSNLLAGIGLLGAVMRWEVIRLFHVRRYN